MDQEVLGSRPRGGTIPQLEFVVLVFRLERDRLTQLAAGSVVDEDLIIRGNHCKPRVALSKGCGFRAIR